MKKLTSLFALILLSAMAVSAQTRVSAERANPDSSHEPAKSASTSNRNVRKNDPRVLRVGPSTTYLKNGLSLDDVVRVLGKPISVAERQDGEILLTTCTFTRSEERILIAEFENGVLVRSHIETPEEQVAQKSKETGQ